MTAPDQPSAIEDYALIGDCMTAALVSRNGSIDWLCWPRFDSGACFAALLGGVENGRFLIAPVRPDAQVRRAYRDGSLVLETVFETQDGVVALIDFMVPGAQNSSVVRIVEGRRGRVPMHMHLTLRFDYGMSVPWVTRLESGGGIRAIAGPAMAVLRTPAELSGQDMATVARFTVSEGETIPFVLSNGPSHLDPPPPLDAWIALRETEAHWAAWSTRCTYSGPWEAQVRRSLLVLKALTFAPTGGIVAAPTTSLPEQPGGVRNWDYRFCWLRDATLTLFAFMHAGYYDEAQSWADWLHRSVAGSPDQVQIMYGIAGERRLPEWQVPWLRGYQGAAPVRIGNAAASQLQLDVFGEVMDAMHQARCAKLLTTPEAWSLQLALVAHLEMVWREPDEGIWEVRGGRRQFTFSKVMAWVAFDRIIKDAEQDGLPGPVDRWKSVRDEIHATVCAHGYDPVRQTFTQSFGQPELDASLLQIPMVGFLPHDDPRVLGTVAAIERELLVDGFVLRYRTGEPTHTDGLPPGEGAFLACSFWFVTALHRGGRRQDAAAMFERLLSLCNDVGLLSEEYDPLTRRFTGNFPQAFSHVALVGAAMTLADAAPERAIPRAPR